MYTFNFSVVTLEKGRINYKVKANNKQEAIKKGFTMLKKKNLSYGNAFDCNVCFQA